MTPGILMIIVMSLPNGGAGASFVPVDGRSECESRLARIRPILQQADSKLLEAGCFSGGATFEPFDHDPPADAPRHALRLSLRGDTVTVERRDAAAACVSSKEGDARVYCATSTQALTDAGK